MAIRTGIVSNIVSRSSARSDKLKEKWTAGGWCTLSGHCFLSWVWPHRYGLHCNYRGFGHIVTDYTAIIEDLVSHGYVVFAPTPTYSASVVVFSDGRIASQKKGILSEDDKSPEEYIASSRPLREQWDADEQFAIDQIQHLNNTPGNMFSGQLDLTEIGLAGHSLGGATALEVCRLDSR